VPLQQPSGQPVPSHTQFPSTQWRPSAHASFVPHMQAPSAAQLLAVTELHATHAAPFVPHVVNERTRQVFPSQQPDGQPTSSHAHDPETQCKPVPHGALLPHRQAPVAEHVSAETGSHGAHAWAPVPHAATVGGATQVGPEQQPSAQVVLLQPLHTPPPHVPPAQSWQVAPPTPHSSSAVPGRHAVPEQQPVHDVESQTHVPPAHRCPTRTRRPSRTGSRPAPSRRRAGFVAGQAGRAVGPAEVRGPAVAHLARAAAREAGGLVADARAAEQRWPAPHAGAEPHWQVPASEQLSASVVSQLTHAPPAAPQLSSAVG